MSDDHAFLAAIRDRPDDATLRLVYADWLEERGDERHELIRVEAAMRAVPIWSDEFQRLKPTRNRLRTTLPPDWLSAMDYLPKHRPMFGTLPPTAAERWRLAGEFIDIWHGGLKPGDGYTEAEVAEAETRLGVRLPEALRSWYRWTGKQRDIWADNCLLYPLDEMTFESGQLVFRSDGEDAQGYVREDDLACSDPPIYSTSLSMVAFTFSAAMLDAVLSETVSHGSCVGRYRFIGSEMPTVPNRFRPTVWKGYWEAVDTILIGGFGAICPTAEASQEFWSEFSETVETALTYPRLR